MTSLLDIYPASTVERLRLSFGTVAEQYNRARPGYPDGLIDAVVEYGRLGRGDRMLDIGVGTGQAAMSFIARGLTVTGVDPSVEMTNIANRNFMRAEANAWALTSDFESAELDEHAYDLICSATSWHWLDEGKRFELAARAIAPGGTLAVLWNWPHWRATSLQPVLDAVYRAGGAPVAHLAPLYPHDPDARALAREWLRDTHESGVFTNPEGKVCSWSNTYTAGGYTELLGTYGDHISLDPDIREPLLDDVRHAIEQCGGLIQLPFTTLLLLARA